MLRATNDSYDGVIVENCVVQRFYRLKQKQIGCRQH